MNSATARTGMTGQRISRWLLLPPVILGWLTLSAMRIDRPYLFIDGVNLAFHEAGHVFLRPFGSTLHLLGGTLFQILVPGLLAGYFLVRQQKPFSAAICAWWIGESLTNVAVYMADAREMKLPLVGGGEHDWTQLFYRFGLLGQESVERISGATQFLGVVTMLAALLWMVYFVLPAESKRAISERITDRFPGARILFEES